VIFDLDGLLVDSEPVWWRIEQQVFAEVGVELSDDDCRSTTGLRCDEVVAHWRRRRGWTPTVSDPEVVDRILDGMVAALGSDPPAMAGAHRAVALSRGCADAVAVASSSPLRLIEAVVVGLGLGDAFDVLVSAEHEEFGKPHPAVYLRTLDRLGADAARSVALEDSPNGVRAAVAAGLRCVAVPESHHRIEVASLTDIVLDALTDLTVAHLTT
jgi:sugar-phosphatase